MDTVAILVFLGRRKRSQQSTIDFPILAYGEGESGRPTLKAELRLCFMTFDDSHGQSFVRQTPGTGMSRSPFR